MNGDSFHLPSTARHVVLVWSARDVEREIDGNPVFIPLTATGLVAALEAGRTILDVGQLLESAEELAEAVVCECRQVDECLLGMRRRPWLTRGGQPQLVTAIWLTHIWMRLFHGLRREMGSETFLLVPPLHFEDTWKLPCYGCDVSVATVFWICVDSLRRRGELLVCVSDGVRKGSFRGTGLRLLRRWGMAVLGKWVQFAAQLLWSVADVGPRAVEKDVLLAGLQVTDAAHQKELARRLSSRYGHVFAWLWSCPPSYLSLTPEEMGHGGTTDNESYSIPDRSVPTVQWRHSLFSALSNACDFWTMSGVLSRYVSTPLSRADWFDCLDEMGLGGLRVGYERWRRMLDAMAPRVVIGLSPYSDMGFVRAWSVARSVPFILLCHGVFRAVYHFCADGDHFGVFGNVMAEEMRGFIGKESVDVIPCGSMQFGAAATWKREEHPCLARSHAQRVLFVATFESSPFFPDSPVERRTTIQALHRVCRELGLAMVFREHPRGGAGFWGPYVNELAREYPGTVSLSAETSLFRDCNAASTIVAMQFGGAVLNALLLGKPVIGYLPAKGWNNTVDLLGQMGCLVRTEHDLRNTLHDLHSSASARSELLARERAFVEKYVEDPDGDPWRRAEGLVDRVLSQSMNGARPSAAF